MAFDLSSMYADWLGSNSVVVSDDVSNVLTLRLTNVSGEILTVDSAEAITLFFPVGDKDYYFVTQEQARAIICTTPYDWKYILDETKFIWSVSPVKTLQIPVGESVVIVFSNIVTQKKYLTGSMSCLSISTGSQGMSDPLIQLPIFMDTAPVKIKKFTCTHSMVGVLDDVTFSWETTGGVATSRADNRVISEPGLSGNSLADDCTTNEEPDLYAPGLTGVFLLPDFAPGQVQRLKAHDSVSCTVMTSTDYSLLVAGKGINEIEHCPVFVFEPEIMAFTYTREGDTLTLQFTLKNTCHCYISCGVGRVDCLPDYSEGYCVSNGSATVYVNEDIGIYELSCLGSNGLITKELRVPIK